jgi:hypothetical protein
MRPLAYLLALVVFSAQVDDVWTMQLAPCPELAGTDDDDFLPAEREQDRQRLSLRQDLHQADPNLTAACHTHLAAEAAHFLAPAPALPLADLDPAALLALQC